MKIQINKKPAGYARQRAPNAYILAGSESAIYVNVTACR